MYTVLIKQELSMEYCKCEEKQDIYIISNYLPTWYLSQKNKEQVNNVET